MPGSGNTAAPRACFVVERTWKEDGARERKKGVGAECGVAAGLAVK